MWSPFFSLVFPLFQVFSLQCYIRNVMCIAVPCSTFVLQKHCVREHTVHFIGRSLIGTLGARLELVWEWSEDCFWTCNSFSKLLWDVGAPLICILVGPFVHQCSRLYVFVSYLWFRDLDGVKYPSPLNRSWAGSHTQWGPNTPSKYP